jgi:hypothetical protein
MLRSVLTLGMTLALVIPLSAGEMDNDVSSKNAPASTVAKTDALANNIASTEMDSESPTQSWRRYGWGGWGRGGWGWGGGWRGGWGWGGGWRGGWSTGWRGGWGWGGGWNVGFAQPWGVVSFSSRPWGWGGGCW